MIERYESEIDYSSVEVLNPSPGQPMRNELCPDHTPLPRRSAAIAIAARLLRLAFRTRPDLRTRSADRRRHASGAALGMVRSMSSSEAGPGSARRYAALGVLDVIFRVGEGLGCAINPKILVPSPENLFLSGPEFRRCDYRHNFEVDQVVPSIRPRS